MAQASTNCGVLKKDDVMDVLEEILEVKNKSFQFGLKLRLETHIVESIHKQYSDPEERLLYILIEVLKQVEPCPTWKLIINALRSLTINFPQLADKLEKKYCKFPDPRPEVDESQCQSPVEVLNSDDLMKKNITKLHDQFHNLKNATREQLEKKDIPVKNVTDALTSLSPYEGEFHHKLFLRDNLKDLVGANDHHELFITMNFHWDYLNYHLLEVVIDRFHLCEVKEKMKSYIFDLQQFRKETPLSVFCRVHNKRPQKPDGFSELVAKFEWPENKEVTLQDVENFRQIYADHHNLKDFAVFLQEVRPGSFLVSWLIPESVNRKLHVNVPEELFRKFFVTELKVSGVSVYKFDKQKLKVPSPPSSSESYEAVTDCSPSSSGYFSVMSFQSASYFGERRAVADIALRDSFKMAGRARGRGGNCNTYKFLEKCDRGTNCRFRHEVVASPPHRECLEIPAGLTVGVVVGSGGCNIKQLRSIAPCGVIVEEGKVFIGTDSAKHLRLLVQKMKLILSQEHVSGPSWIYIHPEGVLSGALYWFIPYSGRTPVRAEAPGLKMYELFCDLPMESAVEDDVVEGVAAMSPFTADDTREGLHSKLRQVHGDTEGAAENLTWSQKTRFQLNPKENIEKSLTDGLRLLCDKKQEGFVTRLDARFGKVTWSKFSEDVYEEKFNIKELTDLLFEKDRKHMTIFNTDLRPEGVRTVRADLGRCSSYSIETFDVKVTTIAEVGGEKGTRLDVRLLIKRGRDGSTSLRVLLVKKNEIKDVTFDILNFHRKHDVRIGLHHYQCVEEREPLYGVVREMMGRIQFLPRHKVRIQPRTSRWSVHLIRHKLKKTYLVDDKFAITVADVSEHSFDARRDEAVEFDMRVEAKESHAEVELHNLAWECAFGCDVGFAPQQALALHMERGSVDMRQFDIIPHPWEVHSILRDFDTFWGHLETLTKKLDGTQ